jgi:hypothetical protein
MMVAALAFAAGASAQAYKWVDQDGKVRYGDTPPPGVKATPLKGSSKPPPPAAANKDDGKKGAAAKDAEKPLSPEAAFRKRQQEKQDAEQKAEKERTEGAAQRENCEAAQANMRQLQTGQRMSTINAAGERVFMDDDQRAQAIQRAQKAVSDWCK